MALQAGVPDLVFLIVGAACFAGYFILKGVILSESSEEGDSSFGGLAIWLVDTAGIEFAVWLLQPAFFGPR